jgi:DNA modification methylase
MTTAPAEPTVTRDIASAAVRIAGDGNLDEIIPKLARDRARTGRIDELVQRLPTWHELCCGSATQLDWLDTERLHLVVTSPPYWTLKRYNEHEKQLGHVAGYASFLDELDRVWSECFRAIVPGGRLVIVVGDVCLARRRNNGRHTVVPLHASIVERCRAIGFDSLATIFWHKIANANYEVPGNAAGFLGKPYEPNSVIKNDVEYILMLRKPGGYRSPSRVERILSVIPADRHQAWFRQIWNDIPGESTRRHPAPFPVELAERLIRMFSFVGDTILDPFLGSGSTSVAAARAGRNSIGVEVDPAYFKMAKTRLMSEVSHLMSSAEIRVRA